MDDRKFSFAEKFDFQYRDIEEPNASHTRQRVAIKVYPASRARAAMVFNLLVGHDVMELLGWKRGYDRIQLCEANGYLAFGRINGQYKLSHQTGRQGGINITVRRLPTRPTKPHPLTPVPFSIHQMRGGQKILLIPTSAQLFGAGQK